ncbi:PRA1 family protein [Melia azedarach]|uniref:PRA1 family protein n=1 Tax=Melia azedarach TaxID=155640 RepID=A0ACC1Y5X8_MELAZ|nr:PRA1 family protein [Melia azedarach]
MTTYGTIPTSSSPASNLEYITRAKERIKAGLGSRYPWKIMFDIHTLKLPANFKEAVTRIKNNVVYFRMNYAIIVLLVLFLSLLWHPISLIVFIVMMFAWLFLYFLRDEPLVLFNHIIDDRVVLIMMSVLTLLFLFFTDATENLLVALLIGAVVVLVHAALRKTDDLFLDEESTGLMTATATAPPPPPAASSSS